MLLIVIVQACGMASRWICILCLFLTACTVNGPSRYFRAVEGQRIVVAGTAFDVRVRGTLAEAIRRGPAYAPRFGPIRGQAATAMRVVSGCRVVRVLGDAAVALGELSCTDADNDALRRLPPAYECIEIPSGVARSDGSEYLDYDCDPV